MENEANKSAPIVERLAGRDRAIWYCFQFVRRRHTSAAARSGNGPNFNTLTLDIFPPIMHSALPILSVNTYWEIQFTKDVIHIFLETIQRRHYFQYCFRFLLPIKRYQLHDKAQHDVTYCTVPILYCLFHNHSTFCFIYHSIYLHEMLGPKVFVIKSISQLSVDPR